MARPGPAALLLLLLGASVCAEDEAGERARLEADLLSPLEGAREEAFALLCERGEAARPHLAAWLAAPDARLRVAAVRGLAALGTPRDGPTLRAALGDEAAVVRVAAAEGLLRMAARGSQDPAPLLAGVAPLMPPAVVAIAHALAPHLERLPDGEECALAVRLGGAAVPAFASLLRDPRVLGSVRLRAARALGRAGGQGAREALVAELVAGRLAQERRDHATLLEALDDAAPSEGLEPLEAWMAEAITRSPSFGRWWLPFGDPRESAAILRWIEQHPPGPTAPVLREALERLLRAAGRRPGAVPPWLLPSLVRAFCILGPPSDEDLESIVRAANARGGGRRQRWREELGGVLLAIEPYREREALRDALQDLLGSDAPASLAEWVSGDESRQLARTVEAWAHYLLALEEPDETGRRATDLIRNNGSAATTAQRSLGAELWDRVGVPPPDLVREVLLEGPEGLRRHGLSWALRALPREEALAALRGGLSDPDEDCFLTAAEALGPLVAPEAIARLGDLALEAGRTNRRRAFRVLGRILSESAAPGRGDESVEDRRIALSEMLPRCLEAVGEAAGPAPSLPAGGGR